jgi:hypothetical protein
MPNEFTRREIFLSTVEYRKLFKCNTDVLLGGYFDQIVIIYGQIPVCDWRCGIDLMDNWPVIGP